MMDPRFKEVLEFIDELDDDGVPTVRAKLALKISAYAQDVDNTRRELSVVEEDVNKLQDTVNSHAEALEEQANRKIDLITQAQDAAVRAAMSGSGGASARLRKEAMQTRERIAEFTKDYDDDATRLSNLIISLDSQKQTIKDLRDSIVRRLNTMSSLADRAGVEFGTEMHAPPAPAAPAPQARQAAPVRVVRRRPRRVRVRR